MDDAEERAFWERVYGPQEEPEKVWPNGVPKRFSKGTGYVYFLVADDGNLVRPLVKIGHSKVGSSHRLGACQTGSPVRLRVAGFIYGTRFDERSLHQRFTRFHSHREWFFFEGDLRAYVEALS